jgi:hypothetical protein
MVSAANRMSRAISLGVFLRLLLYHVDHVVVKVSPGRRYAYHQPIKSPRTTVTALRSPPTRE